MFDEIGWVERSLDGLQPGECCAICSGNFIWSLDELPVSLLSSNGEGNLHMVGDHLLNLDE
jgi:hypothetical protein